MQVHLQLLIPPTTPNADLPRHAAPAICCVPMRCAPVVSGALCLPETCSFSRIPHPQIVSNKVTTDLTWSLVGVAGVGDDIVSAPGGGGLLGRERGLAAS